MENVIVMLNDSIRDWIAIFGLLLGLIQTAIAFHQLKGNRDRIAEHGGNPASAADVQSRKSSDQELIQVNASNLVSIFLAGWLRFSGGLYVGAICTSFGLSVVFGYEQSLRSWVVGIFFVVAIIQSFAFLSLLFEGQHVVNKKFGDKSSRWYLLGTIVLAVFVTILPTIWALLSFEQYTVVFAVSQLSAPAVYVLLMLIGLAEKVFDSIFFVINDFRDWILSLPRRAKLQKSARRIQSRYESALGKQKFQSVQDNDPCPCGSGKKFKNCHGLH